MKIRLIGFFFSSLALFACAGEESSGITDSSTVSIRVDLSATDLGLVRIQFEVSGGPLAAPVVGEVEPNGDSVSFKLSVLPVGTDYELVLLAFNDKDEQVCVGGASFTIREGETTQINPVLACTTSETAGLGSLDVDTSLRLNVCPSFDAVWISASAVNVGESVEVGVMAHDFDGQPELLSHAWSQATSSTSIGTFADPAAPVTTFTCDAAGDALLLHSLSDGDPACADARQLSVTCVQPPVCGDGLVEGDESCDDGNLLDGDGCSALCAIELAPVCGDGLVEGSESCDDGNLLDGDGCSALCAIELAPVCGDGLVEGSESCDDGNLLDGDGCSALCAIELAPVCGDGLVEGSESCDDGNLLDGDGCSALCAIELAPVCGDGLVEGSESCDDGNLLDGDGCSSLCLLEP